MVSAPAPKVTVLMPVYNAEHHLRASIDSILGQSFTDFELLIVDDGSTDASPAIVSGYADARIRLVRNTSNQGVVRTLNTGIAEARGAYIARQDADDVALPGRLEAQVPVLDASPDVVLVGGWLRLIGDDDQVIGEWRYPAQPDAIAWAMHFNSAIGNSAATYRTDVVRALEGYSPRFPFAEDYELWSRMARRGTLVNLPEVVGLYRIHDQAATSRFRADLEQCRAEIVRSHLERTLGTPVSDGEVALAVGGAPGGFEGAARAIDFHLRLLEAFLASRQPSAAARQAIEDDAVERIGGSLRTLELADRLRAVGYGWSRLPARHRLSARWPLLFVGEGVKRRVKTMLGRPDAVPAR